MKKRNKTRQKHFSLNIKERKKILINLNLKFKTQKKRNKPKFNNMGENNTKQGKTNVTKCIPNQNKTVQTQTK